MSDEAKSGLNAALLQRLGKSSHLPALDAVRGIAACLVVFAHILGPLKLGATGVLIFFVLSGFLITWSPLRELERTGEISIHNFYVRRTLRIFPAFYVFWVVCVVVAHVTHASFSWAEAIASFFYMGDYYTAIHPSHAHQIMGITWFRWGSGREVLSLMAGHFSDVAQRPGQIASRCAVSHRLYLAGIARSRASFCTCPSTTCFTPSIHALPTSCWDVHSHSH